MAEASYPDQSDTFDADFKDDFNQGMIRMLNEGSSNDVKIILSDGEIMANKDVLAAQSEYFAANLRWKEKTKDGSDHIDNRDCSKDVMERILKYIFTGAIKFKDLGLLQLLELLNQVRKMLLKDDLQDLIISHIRDYILSFENFEKIFQFIPTTWTLVDLVRGIQYVDRFCIDGVKSSLLSDFLVLLPAVAQDSEAISAISTLPVHIVEMLFYSCYLFVLNMRTGTISLPPPLPAPTDYASAQLRCALAWYNQNKDISQEDEQKILATIDLDYLPAADLFKLVKPSRLFPDDEVDKRIFECLLERDEMKKNRAAN